jgi:sulfide:quinone oxidoreductase
MTDVNAVAERDASVMTRVTIAGAGVAAVECVLALRAVADPHVDIELLAPAAELVYRPVSVASPFGGPPAPRIGLEKLGVSVRRDALVSVDPESRHVFTRDGETLPYELLVVTTGARSRELVSGAATFRGPMNVGVVEQAIEQVFGDPGKRLAFVAPAGARWLVPLYELALLSVTALRDGGIDDPDVVVATPEHAPLEALGPAASEAVRAELDRAGVDLITSAAAVGAVEGAVRLENGGMIGADLVIALPGLVGPHIPGLPHDDDGYLPVDEHGRVVGISDVYAAGDATAFPIKHGGLAAQQADAVADAIGAHVGALGHPEPFRPVLRAMLLTGRDPLYLRAELGTGGLLPVAGVVSAKPLWSPPEKVGGRHLASFLATGAAGAALTDLT